MHGLPFIVSGIVACAILYGIAYVQARSTVYTLTNKRVAMRIGAALTMTLNLPYTWIGTAKLDLKPSGHGTLAFELIGETKVSYLMSWPHVRPWRIARTQPALRCIPDAEKVARINWNSDLKTAIEEAQQLAPDDLCGDLGPLPPMKVHCGQLVEGALRNALDGTPADPGSPATPTLARSLQDKPKGTIKIVPLDDSTN